MPHITNPLPSDAAPDIRITRLNTDKTQKDPGSAAVYHFYFELTSHPPSEWSSLFNREWEILHLPRVARIDGGFLVVHGEIREVAPTLLPALKQAAAKTNAAYREHVANEALALERRENVWRDERKDIDALAASLKYD